MKIARHGIILNTENYDDCVKFYRELFGLKTLFEKDDGLTCLEYGDGYLMIETEGKAVPIGKSIEQNSTKLRFNVEDLQEALRDIRAYGIQAEIETFDWGSTINIFDPDGNRIGIRDEAGFSEESIVDS